MIAANSNLQKWLKSGRFPANLATFIVNGIADVITDPAGAVLAAENIKDSKLIMYGGAYHCIHIELPEITERFYEDMTSWIKNQLKKY